MSDNMDAKTPFAVVCADKQGDSPFMCMIMAADAIDAARIVQGELQDRQIPLVVYTQEELIEAAAQLEHLSTIYQAKQS